MRLLIAWARLALGGNETSVSVEVVSPPLVLLAHPPDAHALAEETAVRLRALGCAVQPFPKGRVRATHFAAAHRVIVFWSARAARTQGMRSAAQAALRLGKLVCVRLDRAAPPPRVRTIPLPSGRAAEQVWRRLLAQTPETRATMLAPPLAPRSSRLAGAGAAIVMGLVVVCALYAGDAAFASRVNQWAGLAHAYAADLVDHHQGAGARER